MAPDLLRGEGDADESRPPPRTRPIETPSQGAIVVTRTHAETMPSGIESDRRNHHGVQFAQENPAPAAARGLLDAIDIPADNGRRGERHEGHPAIATARDERHVETHPRIPRILERAAQVDFAAVREVDGDAAAASPESEPAQVNTDVALGGDPDGVRHCETQRTHLPAHGRGRCVQHRHARTRRFEAWCGGPGQAASRGSGRLRCEGRVEAPPACAVTDHCSRH